MTIEKMKKSAGYEFECNMDKSFSDYQEHDEWGCAYAWFGNDIGVEYNFCMQGAQENCSAIYKMELNQMTGNTETDANIFEHYEIDFEKDNWKEELEDAMCRALIQFFELDKTLEEHFEIRRADMENLQEYRIWKHANEDVWEKCDEHFGEGTDSLILVDVKEVREFDYKGEHFKVFVPSPSEDQFVKEEFFEPIGEVAKVTYHRFTEKDFANVVMKEDLKKEHQIIRSGGLNTGLGYVVGGGYEGLTKELDEAVSKAAELLREHYGMDVVIRFNMDRRSGGAWLRDSDKETFDSNASIGIRVFLFNSKLQSMSAEEYMKLSMYEMDTLRRQSDGIGFETGIHLEKAKHSVPANSECICREYEWRRHESLEDAAKYLFSYAEGLKEQPKLGLDEKIQKASGQVVGTVAEKGHSRETVQRDM